MLTLPNGFPHAIYEERARRCAAILPEVIDTTDKEMVKVAITWMRDLLDAMDGCPGDRWVRRIDATIRMISKLEAKLRD